MPLTDEAGAKSYLARLKDGLAGGGIALHGIVTYQWMLDKKRTADEMLAQVCAACDLQILDATPATPRIFPSEAAL